MKHLKLIRKIIGIALIIFSFYLIACGGVMCWFFRDGMGPDAITSHGMEAFSRFWSDYWLALLMGILSLIVGILFVRPHLIEMFLKQK